MPDPRDARALELLAEAIADEIWTEEIEPAIPSQPTRAAADARRGARVEPGSNEDSGGQVKCGA